MIFQTIFMYIIISSCCLIYGIGIKDLLISSNKISKIGTSFLKTFFIVITAIIIMWIVMRYILTQHGFQMISPVLLLILLVSLSILLDHFRPGVFKTNSRDFTLSFFAVFLAINEGTTILDTYVIGITTVVAYYGLVFLLYCVNRKNSMVVTSPYFSTIALILITLACLILALYGWNVSWLSNNFFTIL